MKAKHLGLYRRGTSIVLQCVDMIDALNPQIYEYLGTRLTTKQQLIAGKWELYKHFSQLRPFQGCKRLIVE